MTEHEELGDIKSAHAKNFQQIARRIGENVDKLGLTEQEFDEFIDTSRQELYDTTHPDNDQSDLPKSCQSKNS